ncbi:MAG: hypothetical protein JW816_02850 [Candidatus Buchananbacteria bacterium]|nr:hypothetical protein [Candidatus Buchananbacteria bacterium]
MKTKLKKLIFSKKFQFSLLFAVVFFAFVFLPFVNAVHAQSATTPTAQQQQAALDQAKAKPGPFESAVAIVLGYIAQLILSLLGLVFSLEVRLLMWVVSYNSFITAAPVNYGWTLVRDISNMFFVLILLVIAIGTILHYESYNIKKSLPKLLLMAVLVNFSLTISGLILDVAQVIMLTFVAAFAGTAGEGNLIAVMHIDSIVKADANNSAGFSLLNIVVTLLLSIILVLIATVVIGVILMVFIFRIVMIWILLVLSPLAYILSAFKEGEKYASQWWSEYSKYVIVGPILAFFLWLTFAIATAETSSQANLLGSAIKDNQPASFGGGVSAGLNASQSIDGITSDPDSGVLSGIARIDEFAGFVVAIAMLLGSLVITQQLGVAGGSLAGKAMGKIKGAASVLPNTLAKTAGWATKYAGRRVDDAQSALLWKGGGKLVSLLGGKKVGEKMQQFGQTGGFKFRTLPTAIKTWSDRVEKERLGVSAERQTDMLNRLMPFNRSNTSEANNAERRRQLEAGKDVASLGDTGIMLEELMTLVNDKGQITGTQTEKDRAQILLENIAKQGDIDLFGSSLNTQEKFKGIKEAMAKADPSLVSADGNLVEFDARGLREAFRHMWGSDSEAAKSINFLTPSLESANDLSYAGIVNRKQNALGGVSYDFNDDKTQQAIASGKLKANEPQGVARTSRTRMFAKAKYQAVWNEEKGEYEEKAIYNELQDFMKQEGNFTEFLRVFDQQAEHLRTDYRTSIADDSTGYSQALYNQAVEFDNENGNTALQDLVTNLVAKVKNTTSKGASSVDPNLFSAQKARLAAGMSGGGISTSAPIPASPAAVVLPVFHPPAPAGGGSPSPTPAPATGRPRPRPRAEIGLDQVKYNDTEAKLQEYRDYGLSPEDFYASEEYQQNQDQYEPLHKFNRHQAVLDQAEVDKIRGVNTASAKKDGDKHEQAGVGLNFNDPEVQQALGVKADQGAVSYKAEDKGKVIDFIIEKYSKQIEDENKKAGIDQSTIDDLRSDITKSYESKGFTGDKLNEHVKNALKKAIKERGGGGSKQDVDDLRAGLSNAKSIRIHNNLSADSRREQADHELAHERVDQLSPDQVKAIWGTVDKKQRQRIMADVGKRYSGLSQDQQIEEAVVEMVGVGKGVYKPNDKTAQMMNRVGIETKAQISEKEVSEMMAKLSALTVAGGKKFKGGVSAVGNVSALATGVVGKYATLPVKPLVGISKQLGGYIGQYIKNIQNKNASKPLADFMGSAQFYTDARVKREEMEAEILPIINQKQAQKARNSKEYQKALSARKAAINSGNSQEATVQSGLVNNYVRENKQLDQEIKTLEQRVRAAKNLEAEAISSLIESKEKLMAKEKSKPVPTQESSGIKSTSAPISYAATRGGIEPQSVSRQAQSQPTKARNENSDIIEESGRPTKRQDIFQGGVVQQYVDRADDSIVKAMNGLSQGNLPNQAADSLGNVEGVLQDILAAIRQSESSGVAGSPAINALKSELQAGLKSVSFQRNNIQQDTSKFDSLGTQLLLRRINRSLSKLGKNQLGRKEKLDIPESEK